MKNNLVNIYRAVEIIVISLINRKQIMDERQVYTFKPWAKSMGKTIRDVKAIAVMKVEVTCT